MDQLPHVHYLKFEKFLGKISSMYIRNFGETLDLSFGHSVIYLKIKGGGRETFEKFQEFRRNFEIHLWLFRKF